MPDPLVCAGIEPLLSLPQTADALGLKRSRLRDCWRAMVEADGFPPPLSSGDPNGERQQRLWSACQIRLWTQYGADWREHMPGAAGGPDDQAAATIGAQQTEVRKRLASMGAGQ